MANDNSTPISRRDLIYEIIFEADTPAGKAFDVALLFAIVLSVVVVMLETTQSFAVRYGRLLHLIEWVLTIFFTIEYVLRLYVVNKPVKYATSFYGVVDLLAIVPTYLSIFFVGAQSLLVIRVLRLLRVFRVFKAIQARTVKMVPTAPMVEVLPTCRLMMATWSSATRMVKSRIWVMSSDPRAPHQKQLVDII